jgi:hypothetical protein
MVGNYTFGGTSHGFLLSDGRYTTFDPPGSTFTRASGINDFGQIVGLDSGVHGFLATPVPRPSCCWASVPSA